MHGVAVAGKAGDFQPVPFYGFLQLCDFCGIGQQIGGLAMGVAGIAACADLHGLHALLPEESAGLVKALVRKQYGKYT